MSNSLPPMDSASPAEARASARWSSWRCRWIWAGHRSRARCELRDDLEALHAGGLVDREVAAIGGEDAADPFTFGERDEACIGYVHRQIAIFPHQVAHAAAMLRVEIDDPDSP